MIEKVGKDLDMIQLSIFSNRFMSIAEQMGRYYILIVCLVQLYIHFLYVNSFSFTRCYFIFNYMLVLSLIHLLGVT